MYVGYGSLCLSRSFSISLLRRFAAGCRLSRPDRLCTVEEERGRCLI